jgi:hypothetical protein
VFLRTQQNSASTVLKETALRYLDQNFRINVQMMASAEGILWNAQVLESAQVATHNAQTILVFEVWTNSTTVTSSKTAHGSFLMGQ